jgi:hypothetical protein
MGALLWVASTGLACGLWALGRELGLRVLAPLLPLLTLAVLPDELRRNLDVYTAENVGRMVAVAGLLIGVRALRDRSGWLEPALAALLFGAGFATHGVPVVALMVALGWYGVARLLLDRHRGAVLARMAVVAVAAPAVTVADRARALVRAPVGHSVRLLEELHDGSRSAPRTLLAPGRRRGRRGRGAGQE